MALNHLNTYRTLAAMGISMAMANRTACMRLPEGCKIGFDTQQNTCQEQCELDCLLYVKRGPKLSPQKSKCE